MLPVVLGLRLPILLGQFATEHIITPTENISDLLTGDVDNDGRTDLVSCGAKGPIFLYRGGDNGTFLPPQIIGLHGNLTEEESGLTDIDGDADLDVVYHDGSSAIRALRNDGAGNFSPPEDLFAMAYALNDEVVLRDLDGDADVDILLAREVFNDNQILWYSNDGTGAYTLMSTIASTSNSGYWVRAADIDGDGDADVITSRTSDNDILWYDNDGSGDFSAAIVVPSGSQGFIERVRIADLNADGSEDICFRDEDRRVWLLLTQPGGFQGPMLLYSNGNAYINTDLRLADMDADGTTDVVFGNNDVFIGYLANPGDGAFPVVPDTLIHFPASELSHLFITADMDNNGVQDIALKALYSLVYFPDQGGGIMGHPKTLSRGMGQSKFLMADLDLDGDPDALALQPYLYSAYGTLVLAALNDGSGVFARPDTIANIGLDVGAADEPWQVHDMDDDGDQDILFVDHHLGAMHLSWLGNNGYNHFDSLVVVHNNVQNYALTDLDQDGQEDLIIIDLDLGSHIGWLRGLGAGQFASFIDLGYLISANDVTTGDLDNDGDLDIVVTHGVWSDTYLGFFMNQGGALFDTYQGVAAVGAAGEVLVADMDGDDLEDLVVMVGYSARWYRNEGGLQFNFLGESIFQGDDQAPSFADLDGDGDLDVLSSMQYSKDIVWVENQGAGEFAPATAVTSVHGHPSVINYLDVDGDGLGDLAYKLLPDSTSGPYAYCPGWIGGTGAPLTAHTTAYPTATVFPSPFSQSATIQLEQRLLPEERLLLLDGLGRTVRVLGASGSDRIVLERGDLPSGLYLIQRRSAQGAIMLGRVVVN